MNLANRLIVPDAIDALLLDLDGVIIDSLALDLQVVPKLIADRWPAAARHLTERLIRRLFPLPVPAFWRELSVALKVDASDEELQNLISAHDTAREGARYTILSGIPELLEAARASHLKICVVSNNAASAIRMILGRLDLPDVEMAVVGLDDVGGASKPDAALYRKAAEVCGTSTERCVALEDSTVGLTAASIAGCYTVGVATGATSFADLDTSGLARVVYSSLTPSVFELAGGDPRRKSLTTPNEFVTHMVEHILWRMGIGGTVAWPSNDWVQLGVGLGAALRSTIGTGQEAAVIGMIDDGSCETLVTRGDPCLAVEAAYGVDLEWFLSLKCEQLASGVPLIELLEGLARGTELSLRTRVCSAEDPHHTWEGVFRSVGMCLRALDGASEIVEPVPVSEAAGVLDSIEADPLAGSYGWSFSGLTTTGGTVRRQTAESTVSLSLAMSDNPGCLARFQLSDTVQVEGFHLLLDILARAAGMHIDLQFEASFLSSSHVVTEDVGLVLGKLLLRLAEIRWASAGMSGAGSSVHVQDDFLSAARVAISIEGRKFWKFVSLGSGFDELRRGFLVGQTVGPTMRSEDLDDFIDGLSGGLSASVMVHVADFVDPTASWNAVFDGLGKAIRQAFASDPRRVGLPPGVKATLI